MLCKEKFSDWLLYCKTYMLVAFAVFFNKNDVYNKIIVFCWWETIVHIIIYVDYRGVNYPQNFIIF